MKRICSECGKEYTDADVKKDEVVRPRLHNRIVRLKTETVEARQFTQADRSAVADWCSGLFPQYGPMDTMNLTDKHGAVRVVEYGDWILKSPEGFEIITDDEFQDVYEEVQ